MPLLGGQPFANDSTRTAYFPACLDEWQSRQRGQVYRRW